VRVKYARLKPLQRWGCDLLDLQRRQHASAERFRFPVKTGCGRRRAAASDGVKELDTVGRADVAARAAPARWLASRWMDAVAYS